MFNWDATTYFRNLTARNKLALQKNFVFCSVSGMDGLEEVLNRMLDSSAFVCVSEVNDCQTSMNNTPHSDVIKTIFFAMRHPLDDMAARNACFATIHELFRQYMSHFMRYEQRIVGTDNNIYCDNSTISLQEIEKYAFSGCAVAFCMIKTTQYFNTEYKDDEWNADTGTDGETE